MGDRRPDVPTLVAGVAIATLGVGLLLDLSDTVDMRFEALAPLMIAVLGAILLATGLSRSR